MNKLMLAGLAVLCVAPMALPVVLATTDEFPAWAYPVDPPAAPGAQTPRDDGTLFHVPDSDVALTRSQIEGRDALPDWHPADHPAMPDIVKNGRQNVRACAYCHQPNGAGRPESASLAGLTVNYIKEQIDTFKNGNRIIEVPEDLERAQNRDPRTPFLAYVPKGSLRKGEAFATGGATPCITC